MTRVNLVDPIDLADQHLLAEWREIRRIPTAVRKLTIQHPGYFSNNTISSSYVLGTGHVKFFYDKQKFLHKRYIALTNELHCRKFNISDLDAADIFLKNIPDDLVNDWAPSVPEIIINIDRISTRLAEKPMWYRYHGLVKDSVFFINKYSRYLGK